jgi:hypothetical protein
MARLKRPAKFEAISSEPFDQFFHQTLEGVILVAPHSGSPWVVRNIPGKPR